MLLLLFYWGCRSSSQQQDSEKQDSQKISKCDRLINICEAHEGYPYVWGGTSKDAGGFDCSGFIYSTFKKYGKPIPRTTSKKYWIFFESEPVHWEKAKCSYLVWWTFKPNRPYGHIGIMTKSPNFWQSGSSTGPIQKKFSKNSYWDNIFVGAKNTKIFEE